MWPNWTLSNGCYRFDITGAKHVSVFATQLSADTSSTDCSHGIEAVESSNAEAALGAASLLSTALGSGSIL